MDLRRLLAVALLSVAACSSGASDEVPNVPDHHDHEPEVVDSTAQALAPTDSVETAINASCTTTVVKGLAQQLIDEIQCLKPGALTRIDNVAGLKLGSAVFPYLQTPAASALKTVQKQRGVTMSINSALRALPQQYLLYRWYKTGRCGISLAATPGTSNHEGALAVDVEDNAGWRSYFLNNSFRWQGSADPVHYEYTGNGRVSFAGLSVMAFQRLWNLNHPNDKIAEDGSYGPATESRLAKAPVGGFTIGATCKNADAGTPDAGTDASPGDVPVVPDGDEPAATEPTGDNGGGAKHTGTESAGPTGERSDGDGGGCSSSASNPMRAPAPFAVVIGVAVALGLVRRRAKSS